LLGLRLNELEDQAKLPALDGKTQKTVQMKKMRNAEKMAGMFRPIKVI
jgi:hypothetical protein